MNSTIKDNLSGGAVTVVKTGTGTMFSGSTLTNTYSGGTYILQGQYQGGLDLGSNGPGSFGTGPIYVASNATVYFNNGGTVTNTLYLSPGLGAPDNVTIETAGTAGALAIGSTSAYTFSGTMNLLGSPVTAPPGVRIGCATTPTITISGQITGTGTLDFFSAHTGTLTLANPNTTGPNANNWTGGIIIDAPTGGHAVNEDLKMGLNNQIPSGPNAGNVILICAETTIYARFDLNGTKQIINGLVGETGFGGSYTNQLGNFDTGAAASLTISNSVSNPTTFIGYAVDDGTLSLVKTGAGTQTFNSPNSLNTFAYNGNTTVSNGTLALTGYATIPNSPIIAVKAGAILDASGLNAGGLTVGASQTLDCVGTVLGNTTINGTIQALDPIGTFTVGGSYNLTLSPGGTYTWDLNNASGTAGADPGWSMLNVSGTLTCPASGTFTINATTLTGSDVPGTPVVFNPNSGYTWTIATAGGISGFSAGNFAINTANFVGSAGSWTITADSTHLYLNYNPFQVIVVPITPATQTVNQGGNASFYVVAHAGYTATFVWTQNGGSLTSGGQGAGGANVTIATTGSGSTGITNTLTLAGVDSVTPGLDGGSIDVTVTEGSSPAPAGVTAVPATLNVIDAPYNPNVAQSGAQANLNFGGAYMGGGVTYLTATASGTQPFTYVWSLNGSVISGATNSVLPVNISLASAGTYTVVISNPAGMTSTTFVVGPVTVVPHQMIFEPFDSYAQGPTFSQGSAPDYFSSAKGITNLYNQLTGEPVYWTVEGSTGNTEVLGNGLDAGGENQFGGEYPWAGLAGNSINEFYWTTTTVNNHLRITHNGNTLFAPGGANTNIYFSFLFSVVSLGNGSYDGTQSVFGGFCTSAGPSACNLEFWTEDVNGTDIANQMLVGVGKGNGTTVNNPTSGVLINPPNVLWSSDTYPPNELNNNGVHATWVQQTILVVGCYTVVDGPGGSNDTVSLWINPPASSFYAATPPPPFLGPTNFGGTVANSVPQDFVLLNDYAPASHRVTDLRIGTTWASVTPPSAPALTLANQILTNPASSTVVFASQNAGNPVSSSYQWTFNNGSGPVTLSDSTLADNAVVSGSSTASMTITGATAAEEGTYTVSASNTDPAPSDDDAQLTGSASALLTTNLPPLSIASSPPNVVLSWPTNWAVALEVTTNLTHPIQWTPVSSGGSSFVDWPPGSSALSGFPSTVAVSGANYTATVGPGSTNTLFFQLVPSP